MFSTTAITFPFPLLFPKPAASRSAYKVKENLVDILQLYFFLKSKNIKGLSSKLGKVDHDLTA